MSTSSLRQILLTAPLGAMLVALVLPASAMAEMTIRDAETECITNQPFPMIEAVVDPAPQEARVYFRSADGEDYYYIQMAGGDGRYQGVLPVPSPETTRIVYYVEAVSAAADASRTPDFEVSVRDEGACDGRLYLGADPQIVIHSTVGGSAVLPQGFLPSGVAATVSAAGVSAPVAVAAGGLGAGAITGIVAGSAVAGAVIIDELDDDESDAASPSDP